MALILALETSSDACSVALNLNGTIETDFRIAPQQHSELLLEMCDAILRRHELELRDLDAIAFGHGPGSFTGLRIAAGVTQGIAFAHNLPVIGISTLAALGQSALNRDPDKVIVAAIDARMGEIYWGAFRRHPENGICSIVEDRLDCPINVHVNELESYVAIGSAWQTFSPELETALKPAKLDYYLSDQYPSAEEIALLAVNKLQQGQVISATEVNPVYLRNQVANPPSQ